MSVAGLYKRMHRSCPASLQDASHLWNAEMEQTSALFDDMVKKLASNCLSDNSLSSISCAEAERDPDVLKKLPKPVAPEPPKPVTKPAGGATAAKIDGIMAGE